MAYAACYGFFFAVAWYVRYSLKLESPFVHPHWIAVGMVVLVTLSGVLTWRSGRGHYGMEHSDLYIDLEHLSGGAVAVEHYYNRAAGSAHLLSQLFLAGPLQLLKALQRLRSLLPKGPDMESRLTQLLGEIRNRNKWHPIGEYGVRIELVGHLIRMNKVDFSPAKGTIKAV